MDHVCLAQWRKCDNETFVKSDNFNHINDRRSETCEAIHSDICRRWDICVLNPVSDLGQMLQTFAEPPGPCSGSHSCPGHLQRQTPACQQAAKRDLDVQVSVHRLGSAGDWQPETVVSNKNLKKSERTLCHVSLKCHWKQSNYKDKARWMTSGPTPVSKDNWAA